MDLPFKWEFPGGKVHPDETAEDCIKREIMEELNLELEIIFQLKDSQFDYGNKKINLIPFVCRYVSGEPVLTEHKEIRWLGNDELVGLDWCPADVPVVQEYLKLK